MTVVGGGVGWLEGFGVGVGAWGGVGGGCGGGSGLLVVELDRLRMGGTECCWCGVGRRHRGRLARGIIVGLSCAWERRPLWWRARSG